MPFLTPVVPDVDPQEFLQRPHQERIKFLSQFWAENGFGTQKMVHCIYIVKLLVLYIGGGIAVSVLTSDVGGYFDYGAWWNEPIVYQKLILWTLFLELFGLGGTWGPLAAHFKPMTGGILYWARPGTIKLPPWPDKVPGTAGATRSPLDVVLYLGCLAAYAFPLFTDGVAVANPTGYGSASYDLVDPKYLVAPIVLLILCGLRDKILFLASRGEQHLPVLIVSAALGWGALDMEFSDFVIAAKMIIVAIWVGAAISKMNQHFERVVPPMVSNTPWMPKALKLKHYKNFPNDLQPSGLAWFMAHIMGTLAELAVPLVLLFSPSHELTIIAACCMVLFHVFIISTFPLAVPLEWNVLFAFIAVHLFVGFPAEEGFAVTDFSASWMLPVLLVGLVFFPILGNLRPDLVSFLPSMRQYAGNWASAIWAFQPGAEARLNELGNPAKNQIDQLVDGMGYDPDIAEMTLQLTLGWRSMHSQGRGLFSVMQTYLGERYNDYSIREAEFLCNAVIGWNFGDGHLHDDQLLEEIQRRLQFKPGEAIVVWVESQPIPIASGVQEYMVYDLALGIVETGSWVVKDVVKEQPWLPNGPAPFTVDWRAEVPAGDAAGAQA